MNREMVIRDGKPTIPEGLELARFVMEITEGLFRLMLGRNPEEIIAATYTQPKNDLSHQNTIFAEIDGIIVGMAAGYTTDVHREFSDRPLRCAARGRGFRVALSRFFVSTLFRSLNSHDPGDFYLHYIGVDTEYRGHGIGTSLLEAIEARAVAAGSRRLTLDVAIKNRGAIAVYERVGMSIVSEWPRIPMIPPVMCRMAKQLPTQTVGQAPTP